MASWQVSHHKPAMLMESVSIGSRLTFPLSFSLVNIPFYLLPWCSILFLCVCSCLPNMRTGRDGRPCIVLLSKGKMRHGPAWCMSSKREVVFPRWKEDVQVMGILYIVYIYIYIIFIYSFYTHLRYTYDRRFKVRFLVFCGMDPTNNWC